MRKSKKKELCNCIHTLKDANRKLKLANIQARDDILPQCQEMAVMIGTEIDRIIGEGTSAVSYLEGYCEEVYKASIAPDQAACRVIYKRIEKLLDKAEYSICYELPDSSSEIVFMPYKASMWDALDSVYRAATQEKNCHVVVMPIPYYNANRKDQQVDMYYEGNLFPEDIPITDYRTYDLEKEHPDVIFIHNPYDDCNYVTQVPEEYFSSELTKYTEHLVYIPYFITKGDSVKDDYCVMPAVHNAWRTFVQSEAVRKDYLKNGANPDRIVAMGSPKFDMVIKMQEHPPKMPEEWKNALIGRKIFLLNTHLNPIINEAEKLLDKLHQIFELFRQREDVALLWRPHPLSIETAKAMNPQMLDNYLHTIEEFKTLSNGVYDETPDVHRAIALSDAYVGNWSSLVTLYGITGKPIYILYGPGEANVVSNQEQYYLQFACGAIVDDVLWAPASNFNALYKIDLTTRKAIIADKFENEELFCNMLYCKVIHYKDKLFFVPKRAKYVTEYSLSTGEQKKLCPEYGKIHDFSMFSEAIAYGKYLYMFPHRTSNIVQLDMETEEMVSFSQCCAEMWSFKEQAGVFLGGILLKDRIWVASMKANCVVEFDIERKQYVKHFLGRGITGFLDVVGNDEGMYLLSAAGDIYMWSGVDDELQLIWKYNKSTDAVSFPFSRLFLYGTYLWALPRQENTIVKVNINTLEYEQILLSDEYIVQEKDRHLPKVNDYILKDDKLIICPAIANELIIVNLTTGVLNEEKAMIHNEADSINYDKYLFECSLNKKDIYNCLCHERSMSMECFINAITAEWDTLEIDRKQLFAGLQANADGSCGKKIWKYITKNI